MPPPQSPLLKCLQGFPCHHQSRSRPRPTQFPPHNLSAPSLSSRHSELLALQVATSGMGLVQLSVWNILPRTDTWPLTPSLPAGVCCPMSPCQWDSLITSIKSQPLPLKSLYPSSLLCFSLFTSSDTPYILLLHLLSLATPLKCKFREGRNVYVVSSRPRPISGTEPKRQRQRKKERLCP